MIKGLLMWFGSNGSSLVKSGLTYLRDTNTARALLVLFVVCLWFWSCAWQTDNYEDWAQCINKVPDWIEESVIDE